MITKLKFLFFWKTESKTAFSFIAFNKCIHKHILDEEGLNYKQSYHIKKNASVLYINTNSSVTVLYKLQHLSVSMYYGWKDRRNSKFTTTGICICRKPSAISSLIESTLAPPFPLRIFLFLLFAPCIIWIQYFSACKWRSLNHIPLRKGTPQLPAFNMRWLEFSHCTNYEGHCTGTRQPTIVWVYEQGYGARRDKKD